MRISTKIHVAPIVFKSEPARAWEKERGQEPTVEVRGPDAVVTTVRDDGV